MKRVVLLLALAFLLVPTAALADAVLDFNIAPPAGGSISYDGTATGSLVGSGIRVATVTGEGTPLNDGVTLQIVGGVLNFATGPYVDSSANSWSFGGGPDSFISIIGSIEGMNCPPPYCQEQSVGGGPGWLLWGGFGNAEVTTIGTGYKIAGAAFWDYKCYELLAFFGLGDYAFQPLAGNFNISFDASGVPPGAFTSTRVGSGDVQNTVPEPGTLALLGTGLLSIAGLVRRKLTS